MVYVVCTLLLLVVPRERGYYTINKSSEGSSEAIRWCGKQGNMDPLQAEEHNDLVHKYQATCIFRHALQ
jgi:hypothetical protein